jgi:hypothetical protein
MNLALGKNEKKKEEEEEEEDNMICFVAVLSSHTQTNKSMSVCRKKF